MKRQWMEEENREGKILLAGFMVIADVEKMPDVPEKFSILKKIEDAKRSHKPSVDYGDNGFRFSDEMMEEMGGHAIILPLEWMADYISLEHKNKIDSNSDRILPMVKSFAESPDLFYVFQQMKPQILGVCAYVVINTKDEYMFNTALLILDLYRKYYMASINNERGELQRLVDEHEKWISQIN
jgi:hypothetical protein